MLLCTACLAAACCCMLLVRLLHACCFACLHHAWRVWPATRRRVAGCLFCLLLLEAQHPSSHTPFISHTLDLYTIHTAWNGAYVCTYIFSYNKTRACEQLRMVRGSLTAELHVMHSKQTSKQTGKQTGKQTSKQTSKQTGKQTSKHTPLIYIQSSRRCLAPYPQCALQGGITKRRVCSALTASL